MKFFHVDALTLLLTKAEVEQTIYMTQLLNA